MMSRPSRPRPDRLARAVALVLARLPAVERDVLTRRVGLHDGHPASRASVAQATGLHTSEVADIEARAMTRLQEVVGADAARQMLADAS